MGCWSINGLICAPTSGIRSVNLIPTSPTFGDDFAALCAALIKTDSNEHQKHFPDSAREGITGVTMFIVRDAHARGAVPKLADVREIMCLEPKALRAAIEQMMKLGDYDINTRLQKFLAETNEISGIRSTIETQTAWMTQIMREDMDTARA